MNNSMSFVLKPTRFAFLCLALSLSVSACKLREPDHFSKNTIRVEEEKVVHEVAVTDLTPVAVDALSTHYRRHGDGPLNLTVTYDPQSKQSSAMSARDDAVRVADLLRRNGVHNVKTSVLPVKDSGSSGAIISYLGYNALAPKDCEVMPGLNNRAINADEDYKMGCSVDTLFARQIARPKDLLGQETSATVDGRRAANQVELYRTGQPNEALEGESASE
jgi:pilus biogenesis lipoprotein CpaD